jgi:hypothetical protein
MHDAWVSCRDSWMPLRHSPLSRDRWLPTPNPSSSCTLLLAVHYVGRIAATGEEFLNTRDDNRNEEPEQLVAGRGER